ncbi:hypothetical protein [Streptomyces violarus]|uniref:hypothetical protein n=1 Tax=Streptomyces violarus TaxID=67380 RepID=UPI003704BFB2
MTHTADATPAAEAMFAADKASRGLGVELLEQGEGTAVLRMTVAQFRGRGRTIGSASTSATSKESR